jgi:hypothetical protein
MSLTGFTGIDLLHAKVVIELMGKVYNKRLMWFKLSVHRCNIWRVPDAADICPDLRFSHTKER